MKKMISWPPNLIEDLAYRRCIIFTGAGISATAKNNSNESPVAWKEFLNKAIELIKSNSIYPDVEKLIKEKNYLLALQAIDKVVDKGRYCHLLETEFSNFNPSNIHTLINQIDPKILVTTNFDKIYEKVCNFDGYKFITYKESENLCDHIRSNNRVIIKAHGDIDDLSNVIFTRRQYTETMNKYGYFYKILEALFMTNTVLFVGYSLNDPDIQLVLENVKMISNSKKPNYIVDTEVKNSIEQEDLKIRYNLEILEYGPDHNELEGNLKELYDLVQGSRATNNIN